MHAASRDQSPSLNVSDLSVARGDSRLFGNLSFELKAGELLFIEGSNGCGKTSLLYVLAGMRLAEAGQIQWRQTDIEKLGKSYQNDLIFVGHQNGVKGDLTVEENIQGFRALKPGSDRPIQEIIDALGLAGYEDTFTWHLSSGQQRRVALARLLMSDQALWILDEPFTSLDKHSMKMFEELFIEHIENGGMVILTSHHPMDLTGGKSLHLQLDAHR